MFSTRRRQKSKVSKSRDDKILMLNVSSHENASRNEFLLDSGASSHMSCEPAWMHNLHPIPSREIRLADNSIIQAHAAGDLILEAHHNNNSVQKVTVKDVLLVPKLGLNLLSCSRLAENVEYRFASDAQILCCQLRQCRHVTDS